MTICKPLFTYNILLSRLANGILFINLFLLLIHILSQIILNFRKNILLSYSNLIHVCLTLRNSFISHACLFRLSCAFISFSKFKWWRSFWLMINYHFLVYIMHLRNCFVRSIISLLVMQKKRFFCSAFFFVKKKRFFIIIFFF